MCISRAIPCVTNKQTNIFCSTISMLMYLNFHQLFCICIRQSSLTWPTPVQILRVKNKVFFKVDLFFYLYMIFFSFFCFWKVWLNTYIFMDVILCGWIKWSEYIHTAIDLLRVASAIFLTMNKFTLVKSCKMVVKVILITDISSRKVKVCI